MQYERIIEQCKHLATVGKLTRADVLKLMETNAFDIHALDRTAQYFTRKMLTEFAPRRISQTNGNSFTIDNRTQARAHCKECQTATTEALEILTARKQMKLDISGRGTRNQPELELF